MTLRLKLTSSCSISHLHRLFRVALCLLLVTCVDAFGIRHKGVPGSVSKDGSSQEHEVLSAKIPSEPSPSSRTGQSRRDFGRDVLLAAATASSLPPSSFAFPDAGAGDDGQIEVYFGCGCFWHVQHEFVEAERRLLGRADAALTARTGYAGGSGGAPDGRVCYHNGRRVADYGSLGHAEVVRLRIPPASFPDFAVAYAALFAKNGFRPDQAGDRGSEYRNLVGFPGGAGADKYLKQLIDASAANGDKLAFARGSGDDPDRRALVFVMDTAEFPFFVSEQYHQFHDGFALGENYPDSYNNLARQLAKSQTLGTSECPNGIL